MISGGFHVNGRGAAELKPPVGLQDTFPATVRATVDSRVLTVPARECGEWGEWGREGRIGPLTE